MKLPDGNLARKVMDSNAVIPSLFLVFLPILALETITETLKSKSLMYLLTKYQHGSLVTLTILIISNAIKTEIRRDLFLSIKDLLSVLRLIEMMQILKRLTFLQFS